MVLNLSNFIYNLLLENETVIIPGFGAFVSTYKPAEIGENEIKPPSKEISFTQQIKNNDGMLAEIIARRAKISQSYAMKRIEKARENMLYELDKGETVVVENIGSLVYNENNEIQFTPFHDENLLLDSFGLETISKEDSIQKTYKKEIIATVIEEIVEPEEVPEKIDLESVSVQIEEETETKIEVIVSPSVEKEAESIQEEKPEKIQFPEFETEENLESLDKKKKMGWYWYLLILILGLILAFFLLNKKSKTSETSILIEESSNIQQQEVQPEIIVPSDSLEKNVAEPVENESTLNVNIESKQLDGTSKYYIVGGSFKDEENVEKYILKLKDKGLNGFNLGQKGKLYLVGIETFDNEIDAQKSLNELVKANPGWNLWIYKK